MVVLRKSDSTTSLLLFVYNNYVTQYDKDTLKLSSLLEIMSAFGKSESAIRMSLSRTVKAGILTNYNERSEVYYQLAPNGKEAIRVWNEGMQQFWKRYALRNKPWDRKWHLLNLEFGEKHRENRPDILERLRLIGFGVLSVNTWISPYYQPDEVQKILAEFDINTSAVEMHGDLMIGQEVESFADKIFNPRELEKSYKNFIKTFAAKYEIARKMDHGDWSIEEGKSLPLLHAMGWEFFYIATQDAVLPKDLFPEWAGDTAAQLMMDFRRILLAAATAYLSKYE